MKRMINAGCIVILILVLAISPGLAAEKTLRVYTLGTQGENVGKIGPYIEEFEAENPDINVELIEVPHKDFGTRLVVLMKSPNPPDIVRYQMQAELIPFVKAGWFMPLDDFLAKSEVINAESWYSPEMVTINDKVYGVPWEMQGRRVGYNKKIYADLGLSPPSTWDELMQNAKKATRDVSGDGVVDRFGWVTSLVNDAWVVSQFGNFMTMNDAHLVSEDLERGMATDEAFVETLRFYAELNNKYGVPNPNSISHLQMAAAFADGTAAQAVVGSWWETSYESVWGKDFVYKEDWDTFTNPSGPQRLKPGVPKTGSNFGGWAWGMSAKTKYPEEAWRLMEFIASPRAVATYNSGLPTSSDVEALSDRWDRPFYQDFIRGTMEAGPVSPALRGFDKVVQAQRYLRETILSVLLSDQDPDLAANELQNKIEGLLK